MHNLDNTRESTSAYVTDEELEASVAQDEYPLTDAQYLFPEQEISSELDELAAELTMLDDEYSGAKKFIKKLTASKWGRMADGFARTPPSLGGTAGVITLGVTRDPALSSAAAGAVAALSGLYDQWRKEHEREEAQGSQSEFELNKRFIQVAGNALSQAERNHADGMPAKAALNKAVKRVQQELHVDLSGEYEFAAY